MIIENLDALKTWLIKELEPICDADPAALAKYVIALAKKDKVETDLKALCEDQLDVFLGEETKPFVGKLFEALNSKAYLPPSESIANDVVPLNTEGKGIKRKSFEENPNNKTETEKFPKNENNTDIGNVKNDDKENVHDVASNSTLKNEQNIEQEGPASLINGVSNQVDGNRPLDARMRSVSQDRSMKSVSPAPRSVRHSHSSRRRSSKSPPGRSTRHSRRPQSNRSSRKEPHDSRNRDKRYNKNGRRDKERCKDYEEKGYCMLGETCRFDHGRDPVEVDDSNLPQMLSLAASSFPTTQNNAPLPPHITNPPLQVFPGIMPPRPVQLTPNAQIASSLNTGLATVQMQKSRPIPSPGELSGGQMPAPQVPIFRPRNPIAFMRNITPGVPGTLPPTGIIPPPPLGRPPQVPGEPYNPEEPSIDNDLASSNKTGESTTEETQGKDKIENDMEKHEQGDDNKTQDELVQIAMGNVPLTPILGSQPNQMFQQQSGVIQPNFPDLLPQNFLRFPVSNDPMALHPQQQQYQQQPTQNPIIEVPSKNKYQGGKGTVLEIRKIPKALNTMVKLSEHFEKFGTITKLQTPFDQDVQGALIEFSTNREAYAAYSSPVAILGNRFIKMFWYKATRNDSADKKPSNNNNATTEEQPPRKVANTHELRYRNPKADPRLLKMEKKKELENLEKMTLEHRKKKRENYEDLVKKQKDISLKLQEKGLSKEDKLKFLKKFKAGDAAVKKFEKELQEETKPRPQSPTKQFQNPKKEILDKEMDIYHGNLEGDELVEAKRDLEMLKQESTFEHSRGRGYRGRGRSSWHRGRGRGRGGFNSTSVDNRPKRILVAGYVETDKDEVVAHFATFGQVSQIEEVDAKKMVLTFPTRRAAEVAAIQGTEFNGKQLTLSWFTGQTNKASVAVPPHNIQRRVTRSLSQSLMEKELEDELLEDLDKDEEEMLLAGVEDEEDDSEGGVERSWKR